MDAGPEGSRDAASGQSMIDGQVGPMPDANLAASSDGGDRDAALATQDSGSVPEGIMCSGMFCPKKQGALLQQCCAGEDLDACGIDFTAPGQPSFGCFPEDAPGAASPSCEPVLNSVEAFGTNPTKFELDAAGTLVAFPACCTSLGVCGVDTSATSVFGDLRMGCLPV